MKFKTTARDVRNSGYNLLAAGYCELQHLLWFVPASAYTAGIYGWNFDVYFVCGATITTGYRGMIGKRIDYKLARKYDDKARVILENRNLTYKQQKAYCERLLNNLVKKALAA